MNQKILKLRLIVVLLASLGFAGCQTIDSAGVAAGESRSKSDEQLAQTIRLYLERVARVNELAFPILRANPEFCGDRAGEGIGLTVIPSGILPRRWRAIAESTIGIDEYPFVIHVAKGSPAAIAGVSYGDKIIRVNNRQVETGRFARESGYWAIQSQLGRSRIIELEVLRGSARLTFSIYPVPMCKARVHLVLSGEFNAFTDERDVFLFSGLVDALEDVEIQAIIAHELAHITERHVQERAGYVFTKYSFKVYFAEESKDISAGFDKYLNLRFSPAYEREADYISMYMLARAGIDTDRVLPMWLRLNAEQSAMGSAEFLAAHPFDDERQKFLKATQKEIAAKVLKRKPLIPRRL